MILMLEMNFTFSYGQPIVVKFYWINLLIPKNVAKFH